MKQETPDILVQEGYRGPGVLKPICDHLKAGKRLRIDSGWPLWAREIISVCFEYNPKHRPTFKAILEILERVEPLQAVTIAAGLHTDAHHSTESDERFGSLTSISTKFYSLNSVLEHPTESSDRHNEDSGVGSYTSPSGTADFRTSANLLARDVNRNNSRGADEARPLLGTRRHQGDGDAAFGHGFCAVF